MRRTTTGLAVVAVALTVVGCTRYPVGVKDSECRYGQSGDQPDEQGAHCLARPAPPAGVTAAAVSGHPLARALAAFRRSHPGVTVSSIGINRWAETTFDTASAHAMTTYDQDGRETSGQNDDVYDDSGSFPLAAASPQALPRIVRAIRAQQPGTSFVRAVFDTNPFTGGRELRVEMQFPRTPDIVYAAAADGSGLCRGANPLPGSPAHLSPAISTCPSGVLPIESTAD